MDPFDAPEPTAGSRERLDRLRERTAAPPVVRPPRPVVPWLVSAAVLAFALGLIANPWFERRVRSQLPGFVETPPVDPAQARAFAALQARVAALEARPATVRTTGQDGGERIARLETRLDDVQRDAPALAARVDRLNTEVGSLRGRAEATAGVVQATLTDAASATSQAQVLLLLGAVRRTLETGGRLGPAEAALRAQLGARNPGPVGAVAALGAAPVTLGGLRQSFDQQRSAAGHAGGLSWWDSVTSAVRALLQGASPNGDAAALDRAAAALRAGNIAAARDAVAAAPQRARFAGWLAAADRYLAGMRGLASLEAAAVSPMPARAR